MKNGTKLAAVLEALVAVGVLIMVFGNREDGQVKDVKDYIAKEDWKSAYKQLEKKGVASSGQAVTEDEVLYEYVAARMAAQEQDFGKAKEHLERIKTDYRGPFSKTIEDFRYYVNDKIYRQDQQEKVQEKEPLKNVVKDNSEEKLRKIAKNALKVSKLLEEREIRITNDGEGYNIMAVVFGKPERTIEIMLNDYNRYLKELCKQAYATGLDINTIGMDVITGMVNMKTGEKSEKHVWELYVTKEAGQAVKNWDNVDIMQVVGFENVKNSDIFDYR